jgi:hypothetical protein
MYLRREHTETIKIVLENERPVTDSKLRVVKLRKIVGIGNYALGR